MRRFWQPRHEDEIERLLRAHRAEPRDEFVSSLLERLETKRHRFRPQRLGRRIAVAAAVTALAAGAGIAAGGVHVAGTSISNLVNVAQSGVNGPKHPNTANANLTTDSTHGKATDKPRCQSSGSHQYVMCVCHHTGSTTNPWVEVPVSPNEIFAYVARHPPDFIIGPSTPCPPV